MEWRHVLGMGNGAGSMKTTGSRPLWPLGSRPTSIPLDSQRSLPNPLIRMSHNPRKIAILGSTGSIGTNALEVVGASDGRLEVIALAAHQRLPELVEQARRWRPKYVVAACEEAAKRFDWAGLPSNTKLLYGRSGMEQISRLPEVDTVLAAVVGSAGLISTWAALEAGKTVALANKETLVMAGGQVMALAKSHNAAILPVDSEHSAVFQLLDRSPPGNPHSPRGESEPNHATASLPGEGLISHREMAAIRRIILTASGGPFRCWSLEQMQRATVDDALAHPTWRMGRKITVDSATMMNKALEIIEARWLFGLPPEAIDVVIHPQSIVHALVEFVDGSVVAQLSPPDMKLPIQYALLWPDRQPSPATKLDLSRPQRLEFEPPDEERFPALQLGREVAAAGGTAGAVVNAANEAAVSRFLAGEMPFTEIVPACRAVLESHSFHADPTLDELLKLDAWARQEIQRWILA
jgi:1-deoxy-D-xylulose-5-phosphate reductoisomerase